MAGIARILSTALLFMLVGLASADIQAAAVGPLSWEGEGVAKVCYCSGAKFMKAAVPDVGIGDDQTDGAQSDTTQPDKDPPPADPRSRQIHPQNPSNPGDSGPIAVFASIEKAWKAQDVKQLLSHFGKNKVAISIAGAGPSGGRFSKSQSYYLLQDLFKYTITKKFEFIQYRNMNNDKKRFFAVAERYYKRTDDGRLFKDKIYVSLQIEGDHWVVDEIKSIQ
jgi:hypothetical protein